MLPILYHSPLFTITSWQLFFCIGASVCFLLLWQQTSKLPHLKLHSQLFAFFASCYLSMIMGARIGGILESGEYIQSERFFSLLLHSGPMSSVGGILGVCLAGWLFCRRHPQLRTEAFHLGAPAGLCAIAIGRIGCFLNGDDYGIPVISSTDTNIPWWAVAFPNHPGPEIYRVPVQLIESASVGLLACWIYARGGWNKPIHKRNGVLAVLGYASIRFFTEFLRGDPRGWFVPNQVSLGQGSALFTIFITIILARRTKVKRTTTHA
ncbi:MAG: prolipoprotein diacylglyceryl transferase [Zetaproteobacteria bacterium]|nr:prolipoprotein diacylglyceryl transferase [Zetaproteobacteria bacterium]